MKTSFARSVKKFFLKKYVIVGIIIVAIVLFFVFRHGSSAPTFQSTAAVIGNVVERVSVTGQVLPVTEADLSFERSGVVKSIYVKVGGTVKVGDTIASLDSAVDAASLASAQAKLDDLTRGLRPAEFNADQAQVTVASTALSNAQQNALNSVQQAYVEAFQSVTNYADGFFTNPQSANPQINVRTQSQVIQTSLNNERLVVSDRLTLWKTDIAAATSTDGVSALLSRSDGYLSTVKSFMSDLSGVVNNLTPGNSSLPQSVIDSDVAAMNSGMSMFNQAVTTVSGAETTLANASSAYASAQSAFALDQAGSSAQSIAAQTAQVALAQAQLNQDTITSPINGIVTLATPNVGEFVAAGQVQFSVEDGAYKVEAYVPEADIAKVAVGNLASSTLDAYGSYVDFPEQVTSIDPAETVLEGVPTYKVTLQFVAPDSRIRSGMTSNLEILTHEVDGVLEIPYRAVTVTATSTTVRLVSVDGKTYTSVPVQVGLKGSDGTIQVTGGLNAGDKVVTYVGS